MSKITIEATCIGCDLPNPINDKGYCAVCAPYSDREKYELENLTSWAREMILEERDILDDIEPIRPPNNDLEWLEVIQQIIPPGYPMGHHGLSLDVAYEAVRNYPNIKILRIDRNENGGTIFYTTEDPDADEDYLLQKFNEWNYQLLEGKHGHPSLDDDRLSEAMIENLSGALDSDPLTRSSKVRAIWKRALESYPFVVDTGGDTQWVKCWTGTLPKSMILQQVLGQVLLEHFGQEPLWRLKAGIIVETVDWRNYFKTQTWPEPRKKSFRYLRQIVESSLAMRATPNGIIVQGESGAEYLLSSTSYRHEDPVTLVLNIPQNLNPNRKHLPDIVHDVCIHSSDKDLPLGDRIAVLALGLANDVKTARGIENLARVVDLFQGQGWR
ncbi:MAG TPA: hypothetical protein EYN78_08430 [Candidatus Poseidoniales archaeon]|nr:hypothetical protein [Candidatus Poseidoniales archaeon]